MNVGIFCRFQLVRLLMVALRDFVGGMVEELRWGTACCRRNVLRQYLFLVKLFEFDELVSDALCMMKAKQGDVLKSFSYFIHCGGNGTKSK